VGHQVLPRDFAYAAALAIPLPIDNDDDFPPSHKMLKRVACPSGKIAGAQRPLPELKGKGKQDLPVAPWSAKGKSKVTSPLRHVDGKKQRSGHTTGTHNYSSEDLDTLFDILEECLPLGGNAWNSVGVMSSMHGLKKMAAPLKLQNLLSWSSNRWEFIFPFLSL
jgi:hypothetical protein